MSEQQCVAEWLTIAAAAAKSGLSIDAIRRRIRTGKLPARQVRGMHGPAWLVDPGGLRGASATVAAAGLAPGSSAAMADDPGATGLRPLVELVRELTDRLDRQQAEQVRRAEAAAMWQARAELLAGELAASREQVKALQAPREAAPREPWWRRWLAP